MAGDNSGPGPDGVPNIANNGLKTNIAIWCLFDLATVFLLLRLYSKGRRPRRGFWWDDYVLVFAWVGILTLIITSIPSVVATFASANAAINAVCY